MIFKKDEHKESIQKFYDEFKENPTLENIERFIDHIESLPSEYTPRNIPWKMFTTLTEEIIDLKKELKKITG